MKVYPNQVAPVIRALDDAALPVSMRGFPPFKGTGYMTNFRNTHLPIWKRWLGEKQYRCVVPARRFAEPDKNTTNPVQWRWFERPGQEIFAFAGIWRPWTGDCGTKKAPNIGDHLLYSIMTTAPNGSVAPIPREGDAGDADHTRTGEIVARGADGRRCSCKSRRRITTW
jgi:putative SOS response-associated peptidase YedK